MKLEGFFFFSQNVKLHNQLHLCRAILTLTQTRNFSIAPLAFCLEKSQCCGWTYCNSADSESLTWGSGGGWGTKWKLLCSLPLETLFFHNHWIRADQLLFYCRNHEVFSAPFSPASKCSLIILIEVHPLVEALCGVEHCMQFSPSDDDCSRLVSSRSLAFFLC